VDRDHEQLLFILRNRSISLFTKTHCNVSAAEVSASSTMLRCFYLLVALLRSTPMHIQLGVVKHRLLAISDEDSSGSAVLFMLILEACNVTLLFRFLFICYSTIAQVKLSLQTSKLKTSWLA